MTNNTTFIGVDFHPYSQVVAYCDIEDGLIRYKAMNHSDKSTVRRFYKGFPPGTVVGVEATGALQWFVRMLDEMHLVVKIGNPWRIRQLALSRHKNDFRDAETILDLLIKDAFPEVKRRSDEAELVLGMLVYRHKLVQKRTSMANQLQAFARKKGLAKFAAKQKDAGERFLNAAESADEELLVASRLTVFRTIDKEIKTVEKRLEKIAENTPAAKNLMTHSGIGPLSSLGVVHTLGDPNRFRTKNQAVAFIGFDPLDDSSADKKRIGHISKQGSRVVRFLLGQAAASSKDRRIRDAYSRVCRRRGRSIAKVAAARRLLVHCFIMLRDNIDYEEFCRRGDVGLYVSSISSGG
jgi:transposase